jgi:hypothetical protein
MQAKRWSLNDEKNPRRAVNDPASLLSAQKSSVIDLGLREFINHLILLVEANLQTFVANMEGALRHSGLGQGGQAERQCRRCRRCQCARQKVEGAVLSVALCRWHRVFGTLESRRRCAAVLKLFRGVGENPA